MRIVSTVSFGIASILFLTSAEAFLEEGLTVLAEGNINIPYSASLSCGACARGGYVYCLDPS